jgi:hypothetical protein
MFRLIPPILRPEGLHRLNFFAMASRHLNPERVRLAILKLAGSDIRELGKRVDGAKEDWEDIINWAERPRTTPYQLMNRKLHNWEARKIEQEDRRSGNSQSSRRRCKARRPSGSGCV